MFASYLDESAELARLVTYRGTFLKASPDPALAPVVSDRENRVTLELAKRRIATSGYRIADVLARATKAAITNTQACPRP